jgi:hypothetical protein
MARKLVTKLKKIWVWDLRSRKSNPGSGSRLDPDPGWIRICNNGITVVYLSFIDIIFIFKGPGTKGQKD